MYNNSFQIRKRDVYKFITVQFLSGLYKDDLKCVNAQQFYSHNAAT